MLLCGLVNREFSHHILFVVCTRNNSPSTFDFSWKGEENFRGVKLRFRKGGLMQMDDDDYKPNIIITRNDDSERESKKSL